ncbi:hypothetical protein U8V72_20875 [Priestia filamentosa]|uniref:hypothetical protein n=1 Tax=Priestia filamentosa TaxID=1402861 RepID=UPI00397C160A
MRLESLNLHEIEQEITRIRNIHAKKGSALEQDLNKLLKQVEEEMRKQNALKDWAFALANNIK